MRASRRFLLFFLAALLSACVSIPDEEPGAPSAEGFVVKGRVAVRYGEEAASGRLFWNHAADKDVLLLSNPVGQGVAELRGSREGYQLRTADGKEYSAADPEELTEQTLGWRLPLQGLPEWIRGRALKNVPAEEKKEDGRLAELRQLGWQIDYLAWDDRGLPQRLRLRRADLDIRMAIEEWQLGAQQ
jgi:outer membrane lipoprotein LolB